MTIVTLIHGTWARQARWSREDSPLATALRLRLNDNEISVKPFDWSGRNWHISRRRAAHGLRAWIRRCANDHPHAKHFLIAHSHGGNVALYALNAPDVMEKVTGVIFLSTPFIQCRPRFIIDESGVLIAAGTIAVGILLCAIAWHVHDLQLAGLMFVSAALVVAAIQLVIWPSISKAILGHSKGGYFPVYFAVQESFKTPPLQNLKFLVVRSPRDEASGILAASSFTSWLFAIFGNLFTGVMEWLFAVDVSFVRKRPRMRVVAVSFSLVCFALLALGTNSFVFQSAFFKWTCVVALVGILLFGAGWLGRVGILIYPFLVVPFLILASTFAVFFGFDIALISSFFEFSAEATPVGSATVFTLKNEEQRGLWHSVTYTDDEALNVIANWTNTVIQSSALP